MGAPSMLTRERALSGTGGTNPPARHVPSQLEIIAQQAIALQAQCNALVGTVLNLLEQRAPSDDQPNGPAMPPVFGGSRNGEDASP